MILRIFDKNNGTIGAIHLYENNYNGEISVIDTFHCKAIVADLDTIFGTNDSEVVVCINGDNKMKELVNDAILFFKMVGASDELSNKGFDTGDIMTVEYCDEIVKLCRKYGIPCDDTMPYGVLDAEYDLEKFFKSKLEEAVKGGN